MSRRLACTLHLGPPPGHGRCCTGSTRKLAGRLAGHALGRGTWLTWGWPGRGGWRVAAQTGPGGTS
jgi:hypothetical protein